MGESLQHDTPYYTPVLAAGSSHLGYFTPMAIPDCLPNADVVGCSGFGKLSAVGPSFGIWKFRIGVIRLILRRAAPHRPQTDPSGIRRHIRSFDARAVAKRASGRGRC